MSSRCAIYLFLMIGLCGLTIPGAASELLGFRADRAASQLELEQAFDTHLEAGELLEWSRKMTVRPHHAGSPQARENAQMMADLLRSWGFDTTIEKYQVLLPTPLLRKLTLLEPSRFEARLMEEVLEGDATSKVAVETGLPPFNAYSADGDVTAELVYVNQGVPRDYEQLERLGIDVRGKIVIARYGGSWRGIKPKVAAEKGAVGCLIYNDPRDDGYYQGETYPVGAYKHEYGVQRGSVLDLPLRPGDPLTPMRGATEGAERLPLDEAETIMKIPVLPLSWRDAQPLLAALEGPVAPPSWRGALPQTYRIGPGPAKVRLQLQFDWGLVPAYNVIAKLEGAERPDQWIVRGNHHDAWVIGGRDPISGMIALLAEAKAVGALAKEGFRPKRTLVYAAWDAEEPGLLGSTEWVEHHAQELEAKVAVYINSDSNSRGFLRAGGSHALETLVDQVAQAVEDPQTGVTVGERLLSAQLVNASPERFLELNSERRLKLYALGSGSDYSPFLQHLGTPSLNIGFGGEGSGGEYHTAFDSHDFYRRFVDPGAAYAVTLARIAGRLSLRLAEADLLPFDYTTTVSTIGGYIDEVQELADQERAAVARSNQLIRNRRFELAADPTKEYVPPPIEQEPPHLNWAPLLNAREHLDRAAEGIGELTAATERLDSEHLSEIDRLLYTAERLLTDKRGLPRRPWFRHHVYAPGSYTGYGVKTLPGVREAIEEGEWEEAQEQIEILGGLLESFAERLESVGARVSSQGAGADR